MTCARGPACGRPRTRPRDVSCLLLSAYRRFMVERSADQVTVPDVVGLPFHIRRDASAAGVTLAKPDPVGPLIGALAWPGPY